MGATIPPESKSRLTVDRHGPDAHEAVTVAPPAPLEDLLRHPTPPPSLSDREQPFRDALDAGARAGSSLSELSKIISELSSGLMGARQANENLVQELSTLRALLGSAGEQQLSLEQRLAELKQELLQSHSLAEKERQFLTEQHDDFVAALLEEHEEALVAQAGGSDTRRRHAEQADLAHEALAKAEKQRDEAKARAEKLERERDELRAEASLLRARLGTHRSASTTPPPPLVSRAPSFQPPRALQLDAGELDSTLPTRSLSPRLPSVIPRLVPPPAELQRAVVSSAMPPISRSVTLKPSEPPPPADFGPPPSGWTPFPPAPEPSAVARPAVISAANMPQSPLGPALKQKPDPSTRPLVDYSLGGDGLPSETLEGARLTTSKPPQK